MKDILLHKLHRYVGIAVAPFLVIQTVSGLLLGFGLFRRPEAFMNERTLLVLPGNWDEFLIKVHFESGRAGDAYHLLLAAGIFWLAVSGWIIHLRNQGKRRNSDPRNGPGVGAGRQ